MYNQGDFAGGRIINPTNPTSPLHYFADGKLCMKFSYERFIQRFI